MMFPWNDRKGVFSLLKALVLTASCLPGLWIGWKLVQGMMGPKPVDAAMHETGSWALRLLLVTLAVTPLRLVAGWNRLILVRRMLGVAALAYALIHLALYIVQQKFVVLTIVSEIVLRFYLTIGFLALLAMVALGATSTDAMIRRLGAPRWNRLHRLIYPLTVLALFHAHIQAKLDVSEEVIMTGIFLALIGVRMMRGRVAISPLPLLALAFFAGIAAMTLEYLWYRFATGVPAARVLAANLDFALVPRPGLVAMLICLLLPALALVASRDAAPRGRDAAIEKS